MDKYKNKYRISSARAQWWDYGWDGSYFITICTTRRRHFFGRIVNNEMELSALGRIADDRWRDLINHAANLELVGRCIDAMARQYHCTPSVRRMFR